MLRGWGRFLDEIVRGALSIPVACHLIVWAADNETAAATPEYFCAWRFFDDPA